MQTDVVVHTGELKWFNCAKGFGFVHSPDGDVYIHFSRIMRAHAVRRENLPPGKLIKYVIDQRFKGRLRAESWSFAD